MSNDQLIFPVTWQDNTTDDYCVMPTLSDLLTIERATSIYFSYARDTEYGALFSAKGKNITVLAPSNSAVIALPRKPHQGPSNSKGAAVIPTDMPEIKYEKTSYENSNNWVAAHVISEPILLSLREEAYQTLLPRHVVRFVSEQDKLQWKDYVVDGIGRLIDRKEACNGVLYIIDSTTLY